MFTRGFDEVQALDLAGLGDEGYAAKNSPDSAVQWRATAARALGTRVSSGTRSARSTRRAMMSWQIRLPPSAPFRLRHRACVTCRRSVSLVPQFVAEKCTGCSKCWVQCPDSAIPGVVNTVEEVLEAAIKTVSTPQKPMARFNSSSRNWAWSRARSSRVAPLRPMRRFWHRLMKRLPKIQLGRRTPGRSRCTVQPGARGAGGLPAGQNSAIL